LVLRPFTQADVDNLVELDGDPEGHALGWLHPLQERQLATPCKDSVVNRTTRPT
jgi:hypothetical protein